MYSQLRKLQFDISMKIVFLLNILNYQERIHLDHKLYKVSYIVLFYSQYTEKS